MNVFTGATGPNIDTGDSSYVNAEDKTRLVTVAGSIALGQQTGIGASIAVNDVNRDTEAYIGNDYNTASGPTYGSFDSTGPIAIDAKNSGYFGTFSIAGAVAESPPKPASPPPPPAPPPPQTPPPVAPVKTVFSFAVAVADNTVDDGVRAYINGATVMTNGGLTMDAEFTPALEALAIGGSFAGSGSGTNVALAGAGSANHIDAMVLTFIDNSDGARSVTATGGGISLTANDGSRVTAQAGVFAYSLTNPAMGTTATTSAAVSIGISVAENSIGQNTGHAVEATIENSVVTATGNVTLTATSTAVDDAVAVGGSASVSEGTEATKVFSVAGAGAYAANNISETIETHIAAHSDVTTTAHSNGSIMLSATDSTSLIGANAIGVAFAYAAATGAMAATVSGGVGVGIAQNTVKNKVQAYIDASDAVADAGISLNASSSPDVHSLGLGIAAAIARGTGLTGSLVGAGSAASNSVNDTIAAYISSSTSVTKNANTSVQANGGGVSLMASDTSTLTADAAGFAFAISDAKADKPAGGLAIGASVANNNVGANGGESIEAYIDNATVTAAGTITISATSTATINTLAIGGAVAATRGEGFTAAVAADGAGTYSTIAETIEASIKDDSTVTTTDGGALNLTAADNSVILSDAGGVSISVAYGKGTGTSISGSIGAAVASNTETNMVSAYIDTSTVDAAGGVSLMATSALPVGSTADYRIDALAFGVAVSGSGSSTGNGISVALAGAAPAPITRSTTRSPHTLITVHRLIMCMPTAAP